MGMGNFPVQNYGRDFNESFVGMGNFITGQKRAEADLDQRGIDNARADRTLAAQEASSKANVDRDNVQTEKLKREEAAAGLLQEAVPVYGKVANDEALNDEDVTVLGRMRVKLPYLTNDTSDNQSLQDAHSTLIAANEKAKTLPPSDKPFKFERGDSPELDKVLDAWNMVVSPARHKTHVDTDGKVTGTPGAEYSTDQIQAGAGISTEGGAKTAAYFSIVDANGAPIYQTDAQGNQVMRVVNGKAEPQRKLVAASVGQTNDPNSNIDFIPADALIMKSKLALEQLQAENKLTPEQRVKLRKEIETNLYGLLPGGVEKLLAAQVKDNKPIALADGGMLVGADGKIIVENTKSVTGKDGYKSRTRQEGSKEVFEESQDGGKSWKRVSDGPKFNPKGDGEGNSGSRKERLTALKDDIKLSVDRRYAMQDTINELKTKATDVAGVYTPTQLIRDLEAALPEADRAIQRKVASAKTAGLDYTPGLSDPDKPTATPPTNKQPTNRQQHINDASSAIANVMKSGRTAKQKQAAVNTIQLALQKNIGGK